MKKPRELWPFLVILVVWVILFWPFFSKKLLPIPADIITGVYYPWLDYKWGYTVGVPVKNPLMSDIPSLLYPWRSLVIDELKLGRWPLWNPYYFLGMPLLANFQSAVFSYVNIFFLFLSKPLAWSVGVMTSPLLTMLAMYFFLRHKGLGKISSLLGGIVFSLSGFETAWMEYNVHGHTALFLPLLLLVVDKIFQKSRRWLFLLPVLIATQIFTGYIPVVIYSYLICFFYVFWFYVLLPARQKKINSKILFLLIFWLIGIAIAAIQILPGYELTKSSIRDIDQVVAASNASYLPLKNLITLIAPDFFGNPVTGNYFGSAFYDNFYLFVGTGTLLLIVYSLFFIKKNKNILFWWLLVLFSFVLIFKNPIGIFLEELLFLSGGVSARAIFILDFSLALLSAYGLDQFIKSDHSNRKKIIFPIVFMGISSLLSVRSAMFLSSTFGNVSMRNLALPFLVIFLCSLTLLAMIKYPKGNWLKLLLLFIISSQLLYSAKKYLPFSKSEMIFPTTPVIKYLIDKQKETSGLFRVELGKVVPQNFLMPYKIETTSGYDALLPKRTAEFLSLLQIGEIDKRLGRVWLVENYDSPLFPLLNTKYILAKKINKEGYYTPEGNPPGYFTDSVRFKKVFENKTVVVYEDGKYLPRAYLVYDYAVAGDFLKTFNLMKSGVDFRNKVILEKQIDLPASKSKPLLSFVERQTNQSSKSVLAAQTDIPGIVFLSESYYPGWEASVNGKSVEILRANYAFKAVAVPSGKSTVILEYKPKSFMIGKKLSEYSLLGLVLAGILSLLPSVRKKIQ